MPVMTDAEGQEQFRLANEVGGMLNTLYSELARLRDAKRQANELAEKAPANSPVRAAAKTLVDKLTAAESELTQIRGEGGQDALNFPGRLDNQLVALYGSVSGTERRLGSPILERYKDLKPEADRMFKQARTALTTDLQTFNAVATKAGVTPITVK